MTDKAKISLAADQPEQTTLAPGRTMTPGQLAAVLIEKETFDVEKLARLMELQRQYDADRKREAYAQAITNFKAMCPTVARRSKGHTNTYAKLVDIDEQIRPVMEQCGLSQSWRIVKDEPNWIVVECQVTHVLGHAETTAMGGPPDNGKAMNALQARASTVSYLQRYTLKALLGIVDRDMPDDDGQGGAQMPPTPSQQAITDKEAEGKKKFWNVAQKKAGRTLTAVEARQIFADVQRACKSETAVDCVAWLATPEVSIDPSDLSIVIQEDANAALDQATKELEFENKRGRCVSETCPDGKLGRPVPWNDGTCVKCCEPLEELPN